MKAVIFLFIGICFAGVFASAQPAEYAVIVHPENQEILTPKTLLRIYKLETKTWSDHSNIVLYILKKRSVRDSFFQALGTTLQEMEEHYFLLKEQGRRVFPPKKKSTRGTLSLVKRNKSAIGIVKRSRSQGFRVVFTFPVDS